MSKRARHNSTPPRPPPSWGVPAEIAFPPRSFEYTPLVDPEKQIRLLRFLPHENDQDMNLEMSTWDIGKTPGYIAISYTWGDLKYKDIMVNGLPLQVRENSHYALWQSRLHYPDSYVWMDAICIAQSERSEKGHQVRIMGTIFESAQRVVACVGEQDGDSDLVIEAARELAECGTLEQVLPDDPAFSSNARIQDLCFTLDGFLGRPYFSRLWIVQEVAAGHGDVEICCGYTVLHMQDLNCLHEVLTDVRTAPRDNHNRYETIANTHLYVRSFGDIPGRFFDFNCQDPKDRIYGTLSLWAGRGPLIDPDYSLSTMDLALQTCSYLTPSKLDALLVDLRLRQDEPFFQHLSKQRSNNATASTSDQAVEKHHMLDYIATCTILQEDSGGGLKGLFDRYGPRIQSARRALQQQACAAMPPLKYSDVTNINDPSDEPAVICKEARASDVLVPLHGEDSRGSHVPMLVLRQGSHGAYDVVGQCICFPNYTTPTITTKRMERSGFEPTSLDSAHGFRGRIRISLTIEDHMFLAGQVATGDIDEDASDPKYWYRCLETNPILRPKGAVTITPIAEDDDDDIEEEKSTDASESSDNVCSVSLLRGQSHASAKVIQRY